MIKKDLDVLKSLVSKFVDKDNKYSLRYFGNELKCKNNFFEFEAIIPQDIYGNFIQGLVESGKSLKDGNEFDIQIEDFKNSLDEPSEELISANFLKCSKQAKIISHSGLPEDIELVVKICEFKFAEVKPLDMLYITPNLITSSNQKVLEIEEAVVLSYDLDDAFFNLAIPTVLSKLISKETLVNSIEIYRSTIDNSEYTIKVTATNAKRIDYMYLYKVKTNTDLTILK